MSVHQTKNGRWYCKYWEDGRYYKKYFGRGSEAKIRAKEYDLEVKKMKLRGIKVKKADNTPEKKKLHFDELAHLYLDDKRNSGWPEKSIYNFKCFMNRYIIPFLGHKFCKEIDMSDLVGLKGYIAKTSKKKISPHSINRYITMTKTVFSWGFKNDFIPFNPWERYKKPKERPDPPVLPTIDEFIRIMQCAAPHTKWALDVEFNIGTRPGKTELFKLKYTDVIDWKEGILLIRSTKTGPREVRLRRDFLERLKEKAKETKSGYIIEYRGRPIGSIKTSFKTALKRANIKKKVRLYDIRHMYGTYIAKNGGDIFALQKLMGHLSIGTTKRYLHHAEEVKQETVNRLPSLVPKISPQKGEGLKKHGRDDRI